MHVYFFLLHQCLFLCKNIDHLSKYEPTYIDKTLSFSNKMVRASQYRSQYFSCFYQNSIYLYLHAGPREGKTAKKYYIFIGDRATSILCHYPEGVKISGLKITSLRESLGLDWVDITQSVSKRMNKSFIYLH